LEEHANLELEKLGSWLSRNQLTLNISKSCYILFTGNNMENNFSLQLSSQPMVRAYCTKYLGVSIDHDMKWKTQVNQVLKKAKQGFGILGKLSYLLPPRYTVSIYYCFVQSHLQYCVTSWGSPQTTGLNKINKIIDKCKNLIMKHSHIYNKNNIQFSPLHVDKIYVLESCKTIFNVLNNKHSSLNKLFSKQLNHIHQTRNNTRNGLITIHSDQADSPIMFHGPLFWNKFALDINHQPPQLFKSNLKRKLINV